MIFDKKKREDEIFKIRQKVYSKLNQGRNVYSSISLLVAFCEGASHHFISSLTPANLKQDDS